MSFRDDIRHAFDGLTDPAAPGFEQRVFSAVRKPVEAQPGSHWALALVAALLAVFMIAGLLFLRGSFRGSLVPGSAPSPHVVAPASPSPEPSPTTQPSPAASSSSAPTPTPSSTWGPCGLQVPQQAAVGMPSQITHVRVGTDSTRDRFVVEFNGPIPPFELRQQDSTTFTQDASGRPITVAGSHGWLLVLHGADEHTSYSDPNDFQPGYPVLIEARNIGDFEGTVSWGLGVTSKPSCPTISTLSGPNRLVIDFPNA
jgi:hypothetical protein